jgi:hypothetical protein
MEMLGRRFLERRKTLRPLMRVRRPACDQQETQGAHAAQEIGIGAFPGARLRRGELLELKNRGQVMRQDVELLSGAVGTVVVGRPHVQGEFALEFGKSFLSGPRPQADAKSAGGPRRYWWRGRSYSRCPSSGVKRSSWKFLVV